MKKIFVLSLHRTGTQSVTKLLGDLGYNAIHNPGGKKHGSLRDNWVERECDYPFIFNDLMQKIDNYQAVSDVPIPALYEEAFAAYPDAKFILVTRDTEAWLESVRTLIMEKDFNTTEKIQYWKYCADKPERLTDIANEELRNMHRKHHQDIQNFFKEKNASHQLIQVSLDQENPGEQISRFLGHAPQKMPNIDAHRKTGGHRDIAPDHTTTPAAAKTISSPKATYE